MVKFSFLVSFVVIAASIFGSVVEEGLKQVSLHDRACMRVFFGDAIKMDQIDHVLYFENKPASVIAKVLETKNRHFHDTLCLKGWHAFKKNEHLFPHPRFIFNESIINFAEDFKVLHIYIFNKQSLENCLQRHESLFKETLGQDFNSQLFVKALEEGHSLYSLIRKDEVLLGILLGFGEESSKAYRDFNTKGGAFFHSKMYCGIDLKRPKGCKIQPVIFMGDPNSQEVKKLTSIYEKELEEFSKIYEQKKDPLKIVLERLCAV